MNAPGLLERSLEIGIVAVGAIEEVEGEERRVDEVEDARDYTTNQDARTQENSQYLDAWTMVVEVRSVGSSNGCIIEQSKPSSLPAPTLGCASQTKPLLACAHKAEDTRRVLNLCSIFKSKSSPPQTK